MAKQNQKILVNVWKPLLARFNERVDSLCLRRDAYLSMLLNSEVKHLDKEVPIANSEYAYSHISEHLELLPRKALTLSLDPETVRELNFTCKRKSIHRDSFVNRALLLLVATPKQWRALFLGFDMDRLSDLVRDRYVGQFPSNNGNWNPLDVAHENLFDPFVSIRDCLEIAREEEPDNKGLLLYSLPFIHSVFRNAPSLMGLNCYMPDELVEGSPANQELSRSLDDLLLDTQDAESKKGESK